MEPPPLGGIGFAKRRMGKRILLVLITNAEQSGPYITVPRPPDWTSKINGLR
jgi:hypothetical protein